MVLVFIVLHSARAFQFISKNSHVLEKKQINLLWSEWSVEKKIKKTGSKAPRLLTQLHATHSIWHSTLPQQDPHEYTEHELCSILSCPDKWMVPDKAHLHVEALLNPSGSDSQSQHWELGVQLCFFHLPCNPRSAQLLLPASIKIRQQAISYYSSTSNTNHIWAKYRKTLLLLTQQFTHIATM